MKRLIVDGIMVCLFILSLMRLTGYLPLPSDQAGFYEFTGEATKLIKSKG
ncbi:MAG: hypothetical protein AB8E87_00035 [Prochlorococcus sp.]